MNVRDIWAPGEQIRYEENLRDRSHAQTLLLQRRHRTKDGRVIDVEATARQFMQDGRPVWLTLVNDVTERKRAEAALRESEEQFRQLAGNIPQVFWITDVGAAARRSTSARQRRICSDGPLPDDPRPSALAGSSGPQGRPRARLRRAQIRHGGRLRRDLPHRAAGRIHALGARPRVPGA